MTDKYINAAKELKKNTDVMEMTFEKLNLRVLQYSFVFDEDVEEYNLIVELESMDGKGLNDDGSVKVNLYDEDGDIFMVKEEYIMADDFNGYDTFRISFGESNIFKRAKTARLYMSRS